MPSIEPDLAIVRGTISVGGAKLNIGGAKALIDPLEILGDSELDTKEAVQLRKKAIAFVHGLQKALRTNALSEDSRNAMYHVVKHAPAWMKISHTRRNYPTIAERQKRCADAGLKWDVTSRTTKNGVHRNTQGCSGRIPRRGGRSTGGKRSRKSSASSGSRRSSTSKSASRRSTSRKPQASSDADCPEGKTFNAMTKRCNSSARLKRCPEGSSRSAEYGDNRCRSTTSKKARSRVSLKKCPEGKVLSKSNRCVNTP